VGLQKLIQGKTARDGEVSLPAFYAFRAGSWRDYVNLLHPPYTVWPFPIGFRCLKIFQEGGTMPVFHVLLYNLLSSCQSYPIIII